MEIDMPSSALTGRTFGAASAFVTQSVVSPDGATLYVTVQNPALLDGDIAAFDLFNGSGKPAMTGAGGFGVAITPDGQELWAVGYSGLHITDLTTGATRVVVTPVEGRRIVFTPDGSTAVITGEGGGVVFVR